MTEIQMTQTGGEYQLGCFEHLDFEFVSDFVFRISDFLSRCKQAAHSVDPRFRPA
jgi:hypothetical protein